MNCLIGYGAHAVHPYLLWRAVRHHYELPKSTKMRKDGTLPDISLENAYTNTRSALEAGMLKILSKIGICLLSSYHGAQIFEAIGIGEDVMESAFRGTPSRIGGMSFRDLALEVSEYHETAFARDDKTGAFKTLLVNYGFVKYYQRKEHHEWNAPMARLLHDALRDGRPATKKKEGVEKGEIVQKAEPSEQQRALYDVYQETSNLTPAATIRDMLKVVSDREPIPLEEVEPVEAIMKRFVTGGMSLGAAPIPPLPLTPNP